MIEVVTFTSTFTDTGEYRVTGVFVRDVADKLNQRDCLSDTGATEQADLTAFGDR